MQKRSDDLLVAYLEGELELVDRREVEAWLDSDSAARDQLAALAISAKLVRRAFDEVLHEPVPERLIAAARAETVAAEAASPDLALRAADGCRHDLLDRDGRAWDCRSPPRCFGLVVGGSGAYFGVTKFASGAAAIALAQPALEAAVANNLWLDNAAGYFKLFVSAGNNTPVDIPATGDTREALQKISQSLPQQVRLPDLKPWGLNFHGARLIVVDGRPAAQLVYTTDNKAIGPLALIVGSSNQPDMPPTFDHRQDVNLIYWRHQGRAYALVGQANIGYLWGIGNDVAWQLDAI